MTKKITYVFAAMALLLVVFTGCNDDVAVTGVSLNRAALTLVEGDTETLTAVVMPVDATNQAVAWTSNSAAVATVDNDGKVTAVAEGAATITATTADGGFTATCVITVDATAITVTGVSLDKTVAVLTFGSTLTLTPTIVPNDATNQNVAWTSSDNAVATVNSNGEVSVVAEGATTITVTTEDGNYTAACVVTVDVLGETSFATEKTWTVGEQTWSDAVLAAGCYKTTFAGGEQGQGGAAGTYSVDCRANTADYKGHLFSWEAVNQYAARLCPDGWRVPTADDFCTLEKTLQSASTCAGSMMDQAAVDKYTGEDWGAEFQGNADMGNLYSQGTGAVYWSSTPSATNPNHAITLFLTSPSYYSMVVPQNPEGKKMGMTVRCVK